MFVDGSTIGVRMPGSPADEEDEALDDDDIDIERVRLGSNEAFVVLCLPCPPDLASPFVAEPP